MSFQAMAWASEQTTGSVVRKAVLYAIANHANRYGLAVLQVETICEEAECGKTAAKTALGDLAEKGLLERKRKRRSNGTLGCYEFQLVIHPEPGDGSRPEPGDGSQDLDLEPGRPSEPGPLAKPSAPRARNLVWDALERVTGFTPTTKNEQSDFGKTVSQIRAVIPKDATETAIHMAMSARKRRWRTLYPDAGFTHRVLRDHWGELSVRPDRHDGGSAMPELPDGEQF